MKKRALICFGLILTLATSTWAAPPSGRNPGKAGPGISGKGPKMAPLFVRSLVQPKTLMRNQARLELSQEQRKSIQKVLREARGSIEDTRWELAGQTETVRELLDQTPIDQKSAMAATAKLFDLETSLKATHLGMLIEITNLLTPEQKLKARALQKRDAKKRTRPGHRPSEFESAKALSE